MQMGAGRTLLYRCVKDESTLQLHLERDKS